MEASTLLASIAGPPRCHMARLGGRALALAPRMAGAGACRTSSSATAAPHPSGLQKMAAQGPQSEMRFSLDATQLQGGGEGGGKQEEEVELPFPSIPHPDYEAEQPQEQTPPEPENPLPAGLPPNHPDEAPKGPPPEVPMPRREPDTLPQFPPDIVPLPTPVEAPQQAPPSEMPGMPAPPEFQPGVPSEMPDRGGSEINFP